MKIASFTTPGTFYEVTIIDGAVVDCSCPHFQHRRPAIGCNHMVAARRQLALEESELAAEKDARLDMANRPKTVDEAHIARLERNNEAKVTAYRENIKKQTQASYYRMTFGGPYYGEA